jgi:hypothetical protein
MADETAIQRRSFLRRGGLVAAGAAGASALAAASASPAFAAGKTYNPITPYRSYDSRFDPAGPILLHEVGDLNVTTDAGGNPEIPNTAAAVTFNLTITQTQAAGALIVYPAGTSFPGVSNINWVVPNLDLANGGTVALGTSGIVGAGSVSIACDGTLGAATHFIVDITGYFA